MAKAKKRKGKGTGFVQWRENEAAGTVHVTITLIVKRPKKPGKKARRGKGKA